MPAALFAGLSGRPYAVAPEYALLYLAARPMASAEADASLEAILHSPLRWDMLLALADRHGVTGLLRGRLRRYRHGAVPEAAGLAMDGWWHLVRRRHGRLAGDLMCLLDACAAAGIEPIVLKGAALAATVYADPALRPLGDIDLLVDPDALEAMDAVVRALGYVGQPFYYGDAFNRLQGYHRRYVDPLEGRLPVEVHWELASRPERRNRLGAAMLRARTTRTPLSVPASGVATIRVLDVPARIVYLAAHAATEGHAFGRLIWLADVAAVVAATPPDWRAVAALARLIRASNATYVSLALTRELLGAAIPADVLDALRPPAPLLRALEHPLSPRALLEPVDDLRRTLVKYLVVDHPAIAARVLRERLLPAPDLVRAYAGPAGGSLASAYARHMAAIGRGAWRKARTWRRSSLPA